jgi:hypothetical protein
MVRKILACCAAACAAVSPTLGADDLAPQRLPENPFRLPKDVIVPGTVVKLEVVADESAGLGQDADKSVRKRFDPSRDLVKLWLRYDTRDQKTGHTQSLEKPLTAQVRREDSKTYVEARIDPDQLAGLESQSDWGGVLYPYFAKVMVRVEGNPTPLEYPIRIPSVRWGVVWGIVVVMLSLGVVALIAARATTPHGGFFSKFVRGPLRLATTSVGGYSLSLSQILFWTCITIFALVYVYFLTASFLAITPQMLVLLGISGGTAVSSKILSQDSLVAAAWNLAEKPKRQPKWRDLIWSVAGADVFKFQMLIFTLLTGYIVVLEICTKYAFPVIPDNLVALMGVSSSVYIGNKLVQRSETEPDRNRLREIVAGVADGSLQATDVKTELMRLLEKLYPPDTKSATAQDTRSATAPQGHSR